MSIDRGSCVIHAQLPELGEGEVVAFHDDKMDIRFGSEVRTFVYELVMPHLTLTASPPKQVPSVAPKKGKRTTKARKRATKATTAKT